MSDAHGTTILAVRYNGYTAMAADGQVTAGSIVLKSNVRKIKKFLGGKVLVGFAGSVADATALLDYFEKRINATKDMEKAAVALAKEWRTNKAYSRMLEAELLLADKDNILLLSGAGDVISAEHNSLAIGSGGQYALAASKALMYAYDIFDNPVNAALVARKSLEIASEICIYTNGNIIVEEVSG
jgi:ATP-dependent HslUV protease, peptidase subunit HslV